MWHRSAHEFFLNSAAEREYGITRQWFGPQGESSRNQSDFPNAHSWEQGAFAVLPKIASAIASPERLQTGLEFVQSYYHANGVTLGCEPGGLSSRKLRSSPRRCKCVTATRTVTKGSG